MEPGDSSDPRRQALWQLLSPLDGVKEARLKAERQRGSAGGESGSSGSSEGGVGAGAGTAGGTGGAGASGAGAAQLGTPSWAVSQPGTTWDFKDSASSKLAQLDPSLSVVGAANVPATLAEGAEEEENEEDKLKEVRGGGRLFFFFLRLWERWGGLGARWRPLLAMHSLRARTLNMPPSPQKHNTARADEHIF